MCQVNVVIAIAGGSGSGKSTLAQRLLGAFGADRMTTLPLDAYYHDLSHLQPEEREGVNFDHPDALDLDLFARHVGKLRAGEDVPCPIYDFTTHCRLPGCNVVESADVILLEGILVAATADLRSLYDQLIYVETDAATRWERRLQRDQIERGRDRESIERFWARAEQTFQEWGSRAKHHAHVLIRGDQSPEAMLTELLPQLPALLADPR